jgi:hypothetical protein
VWWGDALRNIIAGTIGGVAGKLIEYPFDTVKVRLQAAATHAGEEQQQQATTDWGVGVAGGWAEWTSDLRSWVGGSRTRGPQPLSVRELWLWVFQCS